MNDLTLLRQFGTELDLSNPGLEPTVRQRFLNGTEPSVRGIDRLSPRVATRRPLVRFGVPLGAAVLALGLGVAALVRPHTPSAAQMLGLPSGSVPQLHVDAQRILLAAAETASRDETPEPAPGAFLYSKFRSSGISSNGTRRGVPFSDTLEVWDSIDGEHNGAGAAVGDPFVDRRDGCIKGKQIWQDGPHPCVPDPAFLKDFPTGAAAARQVLYGRANGPKRDQSAFDQGVEILYWHLLRPASRAALLEAMAGIPDVVAVPGKVTVNGVTGVAIAQVTKYSRTELVIDGTTHAMLGFRDIVLTKSAGLPAGAQTFAGTIVERGVVPAIRRRPDGSVRSGPLKISHQG